jgi:hypothetical protein
MHSLVVQRTRGQRGPRAVTFVAGLIVALMVGAFGPAAALAAPGAAGNVGPQSDTPAKLKMVVIVGPTHSSTTSYLSRGEALAQTGEKYGMDVRRVFHPMATPERVLANIQGANVVAYLGHGNGWPSPYAPFQERTKNGFGLNPVEGGSANTVQYYGGNWIRTNVSLAANAVVLFSGLCYAEGNGEPGMAIPSWSVARERVDNFAAAFLATGAQAVFAYGWQSPNSVVDMLHTTNKTVDEIFMTRGAGTSPSSGFLGWDNRRSASVRSPGLQLHLDPHSTYGFLRAVSGNLGMTASEWSGADPPTEPVAPPPSGPTVPTDLSATVDATGAVQLAWGPSTANMIGDMKYRVLRNGGAIGTQQTGLTYVDRPTKAGTYSYQVRAIDPAGNKSDLSSPVSATVAAAATPTPSASPSPTATPTASPTATPTASPTATPTASPTATPTASPTATPTASPTPTPNLAPSVPQGLSATPQNERKVSLSWQPSTSAATGSITYRVFRNGSAIGVRQSGTTFVDQPSAEGSYRYQVRSIHSNGLRSPLSPAVTVQVVNVVGGSSDSSTPDTTAPSVPTGVTAEALGYRYVKVTWEGSTDDREGTLRYRVIRNGKRVATVTDVTTYTDRPKLEGEHVYTVRAVDAAGNVSDHSAPTTGLAVKGPV